MSLVSLAIMIEQPGLEPEQCVSHSSCRSCTGPEEGASRGAAATGRGPGQRCSQAAVAAATATASRPSSSMTSPSWPRPTMARSPRGTWPGGAWPPTTHLPLTLRQGKGEMPKSTPTLWHGRQLPAFDKLATRRQKNCPFSSSTNCLTLRRQMV